MCFLKCYLAALDTACLWHNSCPVEILAGNLLSDLLAFGILREVWGQEANQLERRDTGLRVHQNVNLNFLIS